MPATTFDPSLPPQPENAAGQECWLVVDQQQTPPAELPELLNEIQRKWSLDPYTARQRLHGRGYALLLRGAADQLEPLLSLLTEYSIPARLLTPDYSVPSPLKLQGLRSSAATMTLLAANRELTIDRNIHVVAIFADLSGAVIENGMKQQLVRHAYQGAAAAAATAPNDEENLCRAISKAKPVLDLYLLDAVGGVKGAFRALPGRFDPAGLGAAKTLSAGLNLLALIELARSCAGRLTLRSDFGLANLPGCQLDSPLTEANLGKNLAALDRFGRLAVQFSAQNADPKPTTSAPAILPGFDALQKSPAAAGSDPAPPQPAPLPPPPERGGESRRRRWWSWEDALGVVAVLIVFAAAGISRARMWPWFRETGLDTGLVPGVLALFLLWRGLAAIQLKRMIENTPVSRIRSLATGMVEVCGRAERCYALVTPVTQIPCIYYRLRRYRREGRDKEWRLSSQSSSGLHPFWVTDDTGKVLVDPLSADLRPGSRQEGIGSGLNNAFFARESSPDGDEKWEEESIPEGEMLYVLGFSTPQSRAGDALHEATTARLREVKASRELRKQFDKNGDGRIDAGEWDEVRQVVADEVAATRLAGRQERRKQEEALVIAAPPRRSLPFLIAQSLSEGEVTTSLWWRALAFLVTGLLLAIWALRQIYHLLPVSGH